MKTQELKQYIDRVLGNSIRCLLPSYWWKRVFGAVIDNTISKDEVKTINGESILGEGDLRVGVKSVTSVEELNALDAQAGDIATIGKDTCRQVSVGSLERPGTFNIPEAWDKLTRIDKVEKGTPYSNGDTTAFVWLHSKSELGTDLIQLGCKSGVFGFARIHIGQNEVLQEFTIDELNALLKENDYRFVAYNTAVDVDVIDETIKLYVNSEEADAYIKGDSWERLAKEYVVSSKEELNALSVEKGTIAKVASRGRIVGSFNSLAVGDRVTDVEFMQPPYAYGSCSVMFKDKDGNAIGFGVDSNGEECLFGLVASGIETIHFGNENGIDQDLYNQAIAIFKERECTFEWVEGELPVDSFVRPVTNTPIVSDAYIKGETWTRLLKEGDVTGEPTVSGEPSSVFFWAPTDPIGGLTLEQKQKNAESYRKVVDGYNNYVYYDIKLNYGLFVMESLVLFYPGSTDNKVTILYDASEGQANFAIISEDGSVEFETENLKNHVEIREFKIGNLTNEDKEWNLETMEMVQQSKCIVSHKFTQAVGIFPANPTASLSYFLENSFGFLLGFFIAFV